MKRSELALLHPDELLNLVLIPSHKMRKVVITSLTTTIIIFCGIYWIPAWNNYIDAKVSAERKVEESLPHMWSDAVYIMKHDRESHDSVLWTYIHEHKNELDYHKLTRSQAKFIASQSHDEAKIYSWLTWFLKENE